MEKRLRIIKKFGIKEDPMSKLEEIRNPIIEIQKRIFQV